MFCVPQHQPLPDIYTRGCTGAFIYWLLDNYKIMIILLFLILVPQVYTHTHIHTHLYSEIVIQMLYLSTHFLQVSFSHYLWPFLLLICLYRSVHAEMNERPCAWLCLYVQIFTLIFNVFYPNCDSLCNCVFLKSSKQIQLLLRWRESCRWWVQTTAINFFKRVSE